MNHPTRRSNTSHDNLVLAAVVFALAAPLVWAQDDHGDSTDTATTVAVGSSTAGTLTRGDEDYFRFELAQAARLTVQTEGGTDTYGTLMDADGGVLANNDDSGSQRNFRIVRDVAAGTYFARVRGYDSSTTGDYTFVVSVPSPPTAAPGNVQVTPGAGALAASWDAVADSDRGGSAITGYVATAVPADGSASSECRTDATATTCTIDGLPAGTTFSVTVAAENANGVGPASAAVSATTPTAPTAAPGNVQVATGAGALSVSWDAVAEADDGGSPITGYTAVAAPDAGENAQCTAAATETTCAITGLAAGTTFSVTVRADNAVGAGPASSPPVEATTPTAPAAPENVAVVPGLRHLAVTWDPVPEADDGGSPITGYMATATPEEGEGATCAADADGVGCTVEGLAPGTAYTLTASAINAVGASAASTPLDTATLPPTPPTAAPTDVQATPGVTRLTVAWAALALADDGGSPITGYGASTASADGRSIGACSADAETLSCTITGLAPGIVHAVTVHATNALGDGVASAPVEAVPKSRSYRFIGEHPDDGAGWSLAAINTPGGRSHLLIGAPFHAVPDADGAGAAYLIAATDMVRADAADGSEDGTIQLRHVAAQPDSWKFVGEAAGDSAGWGIAPIDDLDGDGNADLAIGAPRNGEDGVAGAVYLVASADFATADAADGSADGIVDLGQAAGLDASWKILGRAGEQLGTALVDAGDVGGDGRNELLLHAQPGTDGSGADVGTAFLLSLADLAAADAADGTTDGMIQSQHAAAQTGSWKFVGVSLGGTGGRGVAAAGDVDGDNRADILLGAPYAASAGLTASGTAYVAAARDLAAADADDDGVVDVADLAERPASWQLTGERPFDLAGERVASAGDIDGDGLADLIVGAPRHAYRGEAAGGAAYLVASASLEDADAADAATDGMISLTNVAAQTDSWKFVGENPSDGTGIMLSSAGDADGDGLADLLIGTEAEATYLISTADLPAADTADGAADGVIDVGNIAAQPNSWKIVGAGQFFGSGMSLISVGDVDGDGVPDVMIGAAQNANGSVFLVTAETLSRLDAADGEADGMVFFGSIADPTEDEIYETGELAIHILGDGSLQMASGTALACSGGRCNAVLQLGTEVTIHADPTEGYRFHQWTGCDNVTAESCTVTVAQDRSIAAYFVSAKPLKLYDHVVTLDETWIQMIEDFDPQTGIIRLSSNADVSNLTVGTVIVSAVVAEGKPFDTRFSRLVDEVVTGADTPTYLRTKPASLTDIFESGTLILEHEIRRQDVASYLVPDGITPSLVLANQSQFSSPREQANGYKEYRSLEPLNLQEEEQSIKLKGCKFEDLTRALGFDANLPLFEGKIHGCLDVTIYHDFEDGTKILSVEANADLGFDGTMNWDGNVAGYKQIKIATKTKTFFVAGVPITLTGTVNLDVYFSVKSNAKASVSVKLSQEMTGKANYQDGEFSMHLDPKEIGAQEVGGFNITPPRIIRPQRGARVGAFAHLNAELVLNGINGAFIAAGPYLSGAVAWPPEDSGCPDFMYYMEVGLSGRLGFVWGERVQSLFEKFRGHIEGLVGSLASAVPLGLLDSFENRINGFLDGLEGRFDDVWTAKRIHKRLGEFSQQTCSVEEKISKVSISFNQEKVYGSPPQLFVKWEEPLLGQKRLDDHQKDRLYYELQHKVGSEPKQPKDYFKSISHSDLDKGPENAEKKISYRVFTQRRYVPVQWNRVHFFRVRPVLTGSTCAQEGRDCVEWSDWLAMIAPKDRFPPTVPKGLAASSVGKDVVHWTWERSNDSWGGAVEYEIEVDRDLNGSSLRNILYTRRNRLGIESDPSSTQCIRVRAKDESGIWSEQSKSRQPNYKVCVDTLDTPAWRFRARCGGQEEYAIKSMFDVGGWNAFEFGSFDDYDGKGLNFFYVVGCRLGSSGRCGGAWVGDGERIHGRLVMYNASGVLRVDEFSDVDLSPDGDAGDGVMFDTGDIATVATLPNVGCNAYVRLYKPATTTVVLSESEDVSPRTRVIGLRSDGSVDASRVFVP